MNRRHFLALAPSLVAMPTIVAAPVPKQKSGGLGMMHILEWNKHYLLSENGKETQEFGGIEWDKKKKQPFSNIQLSPDGKKIAWEIGVPEKGGKLSLCVRDFNGEGYGTVDDSDALRRPWFWLGKNRLLVQRDKRMGNRQSRRVYEVVDVTTWKTADFEYPKGGEISEVSADGETFLMVHCQPKPKSPLWTWSVRNPDGKLTTILDDDGSWVTQCMALSPDGASVVYSRYNIDGDDEKDEYVGAIWVKRLSEEKPVLVNKLPKVANVSGLRWAPDGKRFAYTWDVYDTKRKDWVQQGICTQFADGSQPTQILKCPPDTEPGSEAKVYEWR